MIAREVGRQMSACFFLRCVPIRKHEENEIAERLRIQGSFPQASFDLGCQGKRVSILFSFTPASERPWRSRLRDSSSVRLEYTAVFSGSCWLSVFVAAQPQSRLGLGLQPAAGWHIFFKFMCIYLPYNGFGRAYFF